jgi:hypothetical protein
MPIEASGEQWFRYAYGDWQAHAGFFATDYAKILIRDNPGLEPGQRAAQADRLAQVSDWAAANGRALIVELLVPASAADLTAVEGAVASYDVTLRPWAGQRPTITAAKQAAAPRASPCRGPATSDTAPMIGAPIAVLPTSASDHSAVIRAAVVGLGGELDGGVSGGEEHERGRAGQNARGDRGREGGSGRHQADGDPEAQRGPGQPGHSGPA